MTSEPIRDPLIDHLLTPQNSALVVIDYQPFQLEVVTSMDRDLLIRNIVSVARTARTFGLPIVLSTVGVAAGRKPTIPELKEVLADSSEIDRSSINAWEDTEFRQAVESTGRKKLIMTALWTEMCLAFPSLDALQAGYEVYPVVDAVAGTSPRGAPGRFAAHRASRSSADQLGGPGGRAAAGLGSARDGVRGSRHCPHLAPAQGRLVLL
jgi:nicotinamidase-related amidase